LTAAVFVLQATGEMTSWGPGHGRPLSPATLAAWQFGACGGQALRLQLYPSHYTRSCSLCDYLAHCTGLGVGDLHWAALRLLRQPMTLQAHTPCLTLLASCSVYDAFANEFSSSLSFYPGRLSSSDVNGV